MKVYIGCKPVLAEPQNALEAGKDFKSGPNGEIPEGYKVIYEDGYVSWSPKEVFERCYRELTNSEKELINKIVPAKE